MSFLHGRLKWLLWTACGLLYSPAGAEEPIAFDPRQPLTARRGMPVTYDIEFAVVVTPPYKTKKLAVWLPLPPSDLGQQVEEGSLSAFPMDVEPRIETEAVHGNRFAYFEFDRPQGAQIIRHDFRVTCWELHWDLDASNLHAVEQWPAAFQPYLQPEADADVDRGFRELLVDVVPQRAHPLTDLQAVMHWMNDNFQYDHQEASLQASARHGLERRRGHCSDYHGFCAAMGRVLGFPARIAYGINPFPKNSPSHCKLEAFLPPIGWVSFDISETQKLIGKIQAQETLSAAERADLTARATARLAGGFKDNTWFCQTRGVQYHLAPPASQPVAVVRTIYAEADGQPLQEPDPADPARREFSWMTAHRYRADREVTYPFDDLNSLRDGEAP